MSEFFDVITRKQSYLNIAYSLLSFPLGLVYFIFAVTAFSLGLGLVPILIGVPVLMLTLILCRKIMLFECILAEGLLGMDGNIAKTWRKETSYSNERILNRAKDIFLNVDNWKAVVYIFFKFIYGIITFTVSVTFVSVSAALVCAPFIFQILAESMDVTWNYFSIFRFLGFDMTLFQESIAYMFIGMFLGVITFHVINIMTYVSGKVLGFFSNMQGQRNAEQQLHAVK